MIKTTKNFKASEGIIFNCIPHFSIFLFFCILFFFTQQVLISHQFYTHQCIHVNPNRPIHPTTSPSPLVSIGLFCLKIV